MDIYIYRERSAPKTGSGTPAARSAYVTTDSQVTILSRLRHPCILEVVEPFEESRNSVMFATEQIVMCLDELAKNTTDPHIQLDEVEIQKCFLQLARSLDFLHCSKQVHTNLNGKSVLINAKGDWKLGGCGFLTNLNEGESRQIDVTDALEDDLPDYMKRNLDYLDPLCVFDGLVGTTNDMFALGVLLFMTLHHGVTPYQTHGSMNALRAYADHLPSKIRTTQFSSLGSDVQGTCVAI